MVVQKPAPRPAEVKKLKWQTMRPLYVAVCILAVYAILSMGLLPERVSLTAGEIAGEDIFYGGNTTSYTSAILTNEAKSAAAAEVGQIMVIDGKVAENLLAVVDEYFIAINIAADHRDEEGADALADLRGILPGSYSDEVLSALLDMNRFERSSLAAAFKNMISEVYAEGVADDEVEEARQSIAAAIVGSTIAGNEELFLKSLLDAMTLTYNEVFDSVATAQAIDEAMNRVTPVQVTIKSGQKLVSRGDSVTAQQIEALTALGLQSENAVYTPYIGLLLLVGLLFGLLYFYLRSYQPRVFGHRSSMVMLGVILIVVLLLCKLISLVTVGGGPEASGQIGYLLPVASASMLIAVLLDRDTAIVATIFLAACVGIIMDGELAFALAALAGGLTGVLSAAKLSQRSQFVGASLYITGANLLVIGTWGLIWGQSTAVIALGLLFGLINGLLSAILAMGLLPYLESGFGVTTVIRLLELSNSNHPLLKRLMMEAPGTYNHSILVGNLAETAADAIGANTLLVRVSSYYHDIGKLKRPHFYIENQRSGENPHDKLQPSLSAMIITAHVTDGVKMLKEQRFPGEIIDIVEQHHGNSLLTYFYHKARELALDPDEVKLEDYCYKGRPPQTKEAALVMLADSVQAAVQALSGQDQQQLENRVQEVLKSRIADGQLKECPLTFRDLEMIGQSFMMVLSGMNHSRIAYPELELPERGELASAPAEPARPEAKTGGAGNEGLSDHSQEQKSPGH